MPIINARYVHDLDIGLNENEFFYWPKIKQPFLCEGAEKNLRLLVTDIILFQQIKFGEINCSTEQFYFRRPPNGIQTTWSCKEVIAHLRSAIAQEAKKFNDEW